MSETCFVLSISSLTPILIESPSNVATRNVHSSSTMLFDSTVVHLIPSKTENFAIKEDPNLTEQELKEAKEQLKKVIDQIKSTADQITKTELKTEGVALKKFADDLEKVGGVESEDLIQTDNWVGTYETIVGEVYDPDDNAILSG